MTFMKPINDWNFPIKMMPTPNAVTGEPVPNSVQVIRTDTDEVMGVHGSKYKIVSHSSAFESVFDAAKASNISSDFVTDIQVYEGGRKLRGKITWPNITVEPQVGDTITYEVIVNNSLDGTWAFAQWSQGNRLWCKNGCTTADISAYSKYKHTASINVEGSAIKIANGLSAFKEQKDVWQSYMGVKISNDQAESFFKKHLCKMHTRQSNTTKTNERQLNNLLFQWSEEKAALGPNKWALYNTLTHWATHTQDMRSPHTARHNREAIITSAMRSSTWKELA
jgi:hypothetical protein